MKSILVKFSIFIVVIALSSCSNTKYRGVEQYSKNFTARYNTYFNIKQLYIKGYKVAVSTAQEPVEDILSVFPYDKNPDLFEGVGEFKAMTPKVSKLLTKKPYSKYMDDALLYEGKARYLRGDLDSANIIINEVLTQYPKGYKVGHFPTGKLKWYDKRVKAAERDKKPMKWPRLKHKFAKDEAAIWMIRTYIKQGDYEGAFAIVANKETDMSFPEMYRKDLEKSKAMLSIYREEYSNAIADLNKVLEYKMSKKEASRIHFIIAQLYERQDNKTLAYNEYNNALDGKLNSNLKFEAKLSAISLSSESRESLVKQLKAMTRKGAYQDNIYKIYYTMGNLYYNTNDYTNALENYSLASTLAKTNNQKFIIFEKVAKLSYDKLDYITSAKYYDSALTVIPKNYPREKEIRTTSKALNKLLTQYNIYVTKDSILNLVALGKDKAIAKIEKQIKEDRVNHNAQQQFNQQNILNQTADKSTWYFSDTINVAQGKIKFIEKWGNIKLQDNWKFETNSFATINTSVDTSSNAANNLSSMSAYDMAKIEADRLPFDAADQKPYIQSIQYALIEMARIYNFEIKDKQKAIETYELLFSKYPVGIPNEDEALFSLFRLYADVGDLNKAKATKDILASKYPKSKFTTYANNPNAKSSDEKAKLYVENQYQKAFQSYKKADYSQALYTALNLIEQYPDAENISKAKLLVAFIYSYTGQPEKEKVALSHVATNYPETEEGKTAKAMLDILDGNASLPKTDNTNAVIDPNSIFNKNKGIDLPNNANNPATKDSTSKPTQWVEQDKDKAADYTFEPNAPHYTMFYLTEPISPNSVKTLLNVYNNTHWKSSNLTVTTKFFGVHRIVLVGVFDNFQKATIYGNTAKDEAMLKTLFEKSEMYTISLSNMTTLEHTDKWSEYITFFNKNY